MGKTKKDAKGKSDKDAKKQIGKSDEKATKELNKVEFNTLQKLVEVKKNAPEIFKQVFEEFNATFKPKAIVHDNRKGVAGAILSRHLKYHILARTQETKQSARPDYKGFKEEFENFQESLQHHYDGFLPEKVVSKNAINDFCNLQSYYNRGSKKPYFYATLALYVIYLYETKKFENDLFMTFLPSSERDFPKKIANWLTIRAADATYSPGLTRLSNPADSTYPVSVNYYYTPGNRQKLREFLDRYLIQSNEDRRLGDGGAHFICYRPRSSRPDSLMKTFFWLSPWWSHEPHNPSKNKNANFVNIYIPPGQERKRRPRTRRSAGRIIPMEGGIYLIGGQHNASIEKEKENFPFQTALCATFPWGSLISDNPLLQGVIISSNQKYTSLASKVMMRATPICHSKDVYLGEINIEDLEDDIERDMKNEERMLVEQEMLFTGIEAQITKRDRSDFIETVIEIFTVSKDISEDLAKGDNKEVNSLFNKLSEKLKHVDRDGEKPRGKSTNDGDDETDQKAVNEETLEKFLTTIQDKSLTFNLASNTEGHAKNVSEAILEGCNNYPNERVIADGFVNKKGEKMDVDHMNADLNKYCKTITRAEKVDDKEILEEFEIAKHVRFGVLNT